MSYISFICIGLSGIFAIIGEKPWDYLDEVIAAHRQYMSRTVIPLNCRNHSGNWNSR